MLLANTVRTKTALAALLIFLGVACVGCGITQTVKDYWFDLMDSRDSNLRKRIVVAPFLSRLPGLETRAQAVGKAISQRLESKGNMVMVPFKELKQALAQVDPSVTRPEERIVLASRTLGLNTVLSGAITNLSVAYDKTGIYGFRENTPFAKMELDMKLIDVATGVLLAEGTTTSTKELDDTQATNIRMGKPFPDKVVNELQADLVDPSVTWVSRNVAAQAWVGFILEVDGNRIKTTAGRDTGLGLGSELVAYGRGESIRTGSGRIVYLPGPAVGTIKLTKFDSRYSWGEGTLAQPPRAEEKEAAEKDADKKQDKAPAEKKPAQPAQKEAKSDSPQFTTKGESQFMASGEQPKFTTEVKPRQGPPPAAVQAKKPAPREMVFRPGQMLRTK